MDEATVGQGMIQGGWGYVWAVYGITWAVLTLYTVRALLLRKRALDADAARS